MWKAALLKAPTAHWITMNAICDTVDHASAPFTSGRARLVAEASTTVTMPSANARITATSDATNAGANRIRRRPAPLTNPAWTSAEMGVGATNVPTSHRWNGNNADRAAPATTRATANRSSMVTLPTVDACRSATTVPASLVKAASLAVVTMTTATRSATSPTTSVAMIRRCASRARSQGAANPVSPASAHPDATQPTSNSHPAPGTTTNADPDTTTPSSRK